MCVVLYVVQIITVAWINSQTQSSRSLLVIASCFVVLFLLFLWPFSHCCGSERPAGCCLTKAGAGSGAWLVQPGMRSARHGHKTQPINATSGTPLPHLLKLHSIFIHVAHHCRVCLVNCLCSAMYPPWSIKATYSQELSSSLKQILCPF